MRSKNTFSNLIVEKARTAIGKKVMPNKIAEINLSQMIEAYENIPYHKSVITLAYSVKKVNFYNQEIRKGLFNVEKTEDLEQFYLNEKLLFSGYRKEQYKTYYTSDIIEIKELSLEDIFVKYIKCKCMEEDEDIKYCKKCGISNFRENGFNICFWKISDQYGTVWYKPYSDEDKYKFSKLQSAYKNYAKTKKDTDIWRDYYGFINFYDSDLRYNYALTIHKSQGSEWDVVFVDRQNIIHCCHSDELLKLHSYYTAVSRMKDKVFEIGDGCDSIDFFEW